MSEKKLTADELLERMREVDPDTCLSKQDPEVAEKGVPFVILSGPRASLIEAWVQGVAEATGFRMDWSFVGGRAVVKALGDKMTSIEVANDLMRALDVRYHETDDYARENDIKVAKVWM